MSKRDIVFAASLALIFAFALSLNIADAGAGDLEDNDLTVGTNVVFDESEGFGDICTCSARPVFPTAEEAACVAS